MRLCEAFLNEPGNLLGDHGFTPDPGRVERTASGSIILYHYSRQEHLKKILAPGGGLRALLPVVDSAERPRFKGLHLVEAFLEPLPNWVSACPYYGDLTQEMMRAYVGNVLLRIELPSDFPRLYVADYAHTLECKFLDKRGGRPLNLDYDCRTGREACTADANSYVPLLEYKGGHVAPNVKIVRSGEGIAVPSQFICICEEQPLT